MRGVTATTPDRVSPGERGELWRALVELSKPGITRFVSITTALGALTAPTPVTWGRFVPLIVGTALVVAGANALNMFLERDSDALMTRTRGRPLPEGRISPDEALAFGVGIALAGLVCLAHFTTILAFGLAALSLLLYVLVYTPLKRVGPVALYVGAVPGALPPVIGYAGNQGELDARALSLFLILFVWQLPHFITITLFREEEYARAGLRVLPVVRGRAHASRLLVAFSALFVAVSLLPVWLNGAGLVYAIVAGLTSVAFLCATARGLRGDFDDRTARKLFFFSMPELVIVMAALMITLIF